ECIYKRPATGFELFLHTHTNGHDKITFINEKSKIVHDNVLHLRQEREGNQGSAESQVDETTLYIEAASGAKKRNLYGAGSKRVDYIKDKDSGNETTGITKVNDGRFNITLLDCDSDSDTDGGDAHQGTITSNSRAGESNSRAGKGEEDDHDSRMIVSS
ncbi:PDR ABC-type transporter family protein, partial [Tanacetum coccineum]